MGWTSMHTSTDVTKTKNRKVLCDMMFSYENSPYRVIKSQMVGSTYYAAVENTLTGEIRAAVTFTRSQKNNFHNFSYLDMDETVGPAEYKCPKAILDLLTPIDNTYANNWRKRCYDYLSISKIAKMLRKCPIGTVATFKDEDGNTRAFKKDLLAHCEKPTWVDWDRFLRTNCESLAYNKPLIMMP